MQSLLEITVSQLLHQELTACKNSLIAFIATLSLGFYIEKTNFTSRVVEKTHGIKKG